MKKTKRIAVLAACALALFAAGCKNSSDGSGGAEPEPVAVESVDIYPKTLPLEVGVMGELKVRILPSDATDKTVKWSSSKPEVATVGDDGMVKGVKVGRATITAQAGEITDTCEVTVNTHTHNYVSLKCQTCGFDKPSFKEGDIDDYGTLKAYTGSETTVSIPKGVTCINSEVFKGKTSLTSVTLPDGMTRIDSSAFEGCTGLTSMTIPDGVTYIGWSAFEDCTSLKEVTIPDSVTYIGSYAFEGCTSLKEIQFTGTMAEWKAIDGSDDVNITCIQCSDGYIGVKEVPAYLKISGRTVTGHTDEVPADLVIPDGVTKIGEKAFKGCTELTSVTIGDGVTEIGDSAFEGCTGLTEVAIGDGVTKIGSKVFEDCKSLTKIQFTGTKAQWNAIKGSDTVTITCIQCTDGHIGITEVPPYLKISGRTVTGHTDEVPADLVIPDGVTEIGGGAFEGCTGLASVTIPGSVTKIGYGAFEGCTKLASVTIPGSVTEIGWVAFYGCTSLASVQYGGTQKEWEAITGVGKDDLKGKTITGKDGVTWTAE